VINAAAGNAQTGLAPPLNTAQQPVLGMLPLVAGVPGQVVTGDAKAAQGAALVTPLVTPQAVHCTGADTVTSAPKAYFIAKSEHLLGKAGVLREGPTVPVSVPIVCNLGRLLHHHPPFGPVRGYSCICA
jgi:hypothetical protein